MDKDGQRKLVRKPKGRQAIRGLPSPGHADKAWVPVSLVGEAYFTTPPTYKIPSNLSLAVDELQTAFAPPLLPLFLCRLVFFLLKGVRNM